MSPRDALVLAGPMGAGKTSVGRELARLVGARFDDLDDLIVARAGRTIAGLFDAGEPAFREAEREAALAWLDARTRDPRILALGGGTLGDAPVADRLARETTLVCVAAQPETLARRLDGEHRAARPLLARSRDVAETLGRLAGERRAQYARALLEIDTSRLDAREAATAVLRGLHDPAAGPWRDEPRELAAGLVAGRGVTLGRGPQETGGAPPALLLRDGGLPAVHHGALGARGATDAGATLDVPSGEPAKSSTQLTRIWSWLLERGAGRDTPLHAEGGGALTDVAAFAAATFKRGMPLHLHPTTLLGQLDAALGGKSAVNVEGIKNAVGLVRLPASVHADTLYLTTLPARELRCGLAEAVKSALIGDASLLEAIERDARALLDCALPALERAIESAAAVKLRIVEQDLEERGPRRLLNLGHTLGHAVESASHEHGAPLSHGEAVSIGLAFSARLAARTGVLAQRELPERVERVLGALGLPTKLPPSAHRWRESIVDALAQDKKRRGGRGVWVLPVETGRAECVEVADEDVLATLGEAE